jgi:hypothetical protein
MTYSEHEALEKTRRAFTLNKLNVITKDISDIILHIETHMPDTEEKNALIRVYSFLREDARWLTEDEVGAVLRKNPRIV